MIARHVLAAVLLLSAAGTGWAQSATGGNFGSLPSGSAAWRANGGGASSSHSRHRDSGDGEQGARGSSSDNGGGSGGNNGGREIDARDTERSAPIAHQASTPH